MVKDGAIREAASRAIPAAACCVRTAGAGGAWIGLLGVLSTYLWAQNLPPGPAQVLQAAEVGEDVSGRVDLPRDRRLARGIRRAAERISAGEYSQAIGFLDDVLAGDEDVFVELEGTTSHVGLKELASSMIRDLPPAGREVYESTWGPSAQQALREAVEGGDQERLKKIAFRFFHTSAGMEAALLAATNESDRGQHLAAGLLYQKLLDAPEAVRRFDPELSVRAAACWLAAGQPAQAEAALSRLRATGHESVTIAGQTRRLDASLSETDWLLQLVGEPRATRDASDADWLTYRANAARSSLAQGGLPHMRERWRVRLLHPRLMPEFERIAADLRQADRSQPVAASPLAIGDTILIRTPHQLLAVDFVTGRRVWQVEVEATDRLEELLEQTFADEADGEERQSLERFAQQMWHDYLHQLVSSDGERVFLVGEPGASLGDAASHRLTLLGRDPMFDRQTNRLAAFDLSTQGKRIWEIDGRATSGELAGAFFLGAPTAIGNMLYVMLEMKSAVYVAALESDTGELAWLQQLANLDDGIAIDRQRRLQSSMPSYDSGVLVCPTSAGVVVGVHLASRSLAWAFAYQSHERANRQRGSRDEDIQLISPSRWLSGVATLGQGRVLLTPPDADHLYCLDLQAGSLQWTAPRGAMQRVLCVEGGRVVLAGDTELAALDVGTGQPLWQTKSLSEDRKAQISGDGFYTNGRFYLPLTSSEVVGIDLSDGTVAERATSRGSEPLGNLICHAGAILSHNGNSLDRFDQIEVIERRSKERLATAPRDVEALRTLGEIAFNAGRMTEAIELLLRAHDIAPDDFEVHDVLAEVLTSALDQDFAAYRAQVPLLEELVAQQPSRRLDLLRIVAEGQLKAEEPLEATETTLELALEAGLSRQMLELSQLRRATAGRWVRAQLASIWETASPSQRDAIRERVRAFEQALPPGSPRDRLEQQLEFLSDLPGEEDSNMQLARLLVEQGAPLRGQLLLLKLERSDDPQLRREATARIARQLHDAQLHRLALSRDRLLRTVYANLPCLDGRTGSQCLADWQVAAEVPVPLGQVKVAKLPTTSPTNSARRIRYPQLGLRLEITDDILGPCTAMTAVRSGDLLIRDARGTPVFEASLGSDRRNVLRGSGAYGVSAGNLLVVSLGHQILAINTLSDGTRTEEAVLWRRDVTSQLQSTPRGYGRGSRLSVDRPGSYRATRAYHGGAWIGIIGPVTSEGCVFQEQRRLVCVDPITGVELWSRNGLPSGCDLYGDDRHVLVVPPQKTEALVLDALDGRAVGRVEVPKFEELLQTIGCRAIRWRTTARGGQELSAIDLINQEIAWRFEFKPGSQVDIADARYVAVVEPTGRTVLVDGADGAVLADDPGDGAAVVDQIHLLVGADDFTVAVDERRANSTGRIVKPFVELDCPIINGRLKVFDRQTGKMRWQRSGEVNQQGLLLTQPADLPMVVMLGTLYKQGAQGTRAPITLLAVDKRTGQTLYRNDDLPSSGGSLCEIQAQGEAGEEVTIEMAGRSLLFQFTSQSQPPVPPVMSEVELESTRSSGGILGILRSVGGGD
jgi:outer membrane protein assembly factor BamB